MEKSQRTKLRTSLLDNAIKMLRVKELQQEGKLPQPFTQAITELFTLDLQDSINKHYTDCKTTHSEHLNKNEIGNLLNSIDQIFTATDNEVIVSWTNIEKEIHRQIESLTSQQNITENITETELHQLDTTNTEQFLQDKDYTETVIQYQTDGPHPPQVQKSSAGITFSYKQTVQYNHRK